MVNRSLRRLWPPLSRVVSDASSIELAEASRSEPAAQAGARAYSVVFRGRRADGGTVTVKLQERRIRSRRPGVTLVEVLVSMFIMAIGMLSLLTLFLLGAINMAKALKDDRCASTAAMAEQVAIMWDIRHDALVLQAIAASNATLPATYVGPGNPVYVDPYGQIQNLPAVGKAFGSPGIPRVTLQLYANVFPARNGLTSKCIGSARTGTSPSRE
jgi:competence protein ComGC